MALNDAADDRKTWADSLTAGGTYAGSHTITIDGTAYNTNAAGSVSYDKVADNHETSSATATALKQGWRLPSVTDWRYIFYGLGTIKSGLTLIARNKNTYSLNARPTVPLGEADPAGVDNGMEYHTGNNVTLLCDKLNSFGLGLNSSHEGGDYCSSSEVSSNTDSAWYYDFNTGKFAYNKKTNTHSVRAVFAY